MTNSIADVDAELVSLFRGIFSQAWSRSGTENRELDTELWSTLGEAGLRRLTGSEAAGGSAASIVEGAALLQSAGYFAVRVPIAEYDMIAGWIGELADMPISDMTTVGVLGPENTVVTLPWARFCDAAIVVTPRPDGTRVRQYELSRCEITEAENLAGEPRDLVRLAASPTRETTLAPDVATEYRYRLAFCRSAMMVGALARVRDLSIEHATTRIQFGKPLAALQAVQHLLVDLAAEARLAEAAMQHAARQALSGWNTEDARFAVASARSVAGHAASIAVRNGHQVHGAMGTTTEHALHVFTTRLLAWRSEGGSTNEWDNVVDELAASGGDDPAWERITGTV